MVYVFIMKNKNGIIIFPKKRNMFFPKIVTCTPLKWTSTLCQKPVDHQNSGSQLGMVIIQKPLQVVL